MSCENNDFYNNFKPLFVGNIIYTCFLTAVCPPPLVPSTCVRECHSCHNLQPDCTNVIATKNCVSGCDCAPGLLFNGDKCVEPGNCQCIVPDMNITIPVCTNVSHFFKPDLIDLLFLQTHFKGSREMKINIKGKTDKQLHENVKYLQKLFI